MIQKLCWMMTKMKILSWRIKINEINNNEYTIYYIIKHIN